MKDSKKKEKCHEVDKEVIRQKDMITFTLSVSKEFTTERNSPTDHITPSPL